MVIDRPRVKEKLEKELKLFEEKHPRSKALFERAKANFIDGVPMNWMVKWAGSYPIFVDRGEGAYFTDVDGNRFIDFCLGDTGSMTGHAPEGAVPAIVERIKNGVTFMLPTEDAIWVGEALTKRFGLPYWQVAISATDANRFSLRLARHITKRKYVLVFNYSYHGTVDEAFITLKDGVAESRSGNIGPQVDPTQTTKVIEFNDIEALEKALAPGDVACVLAEPAMTNIGIIHPEPGYLEALREMTRRTGTLLIYDETHTMCAGPGGYTGAYGLKPDMLTVGKAIGGGIPTAVYGFSEEVAKRMRGLISLEDSDTGGIGGTLAGNALSMAAMRATLENVLTEEAFERNIALAKRFAEGVESVIEEKRLPWIVKRLGCRTEYWFRETPPRNGGEAAAAVDFELDRYMHLYALNRGILMTPFHNMALISSQTAVEDVDYHTEVFRQSVESLLE
ncbi:aspartate aminotransferase family protein [Brevibacillus ruminantium]|uniref:Aspartate aminotransferase family protein n=1 Tax=Brevibacillus ruminantium TaxID=2950604 RepID=A0ABY4WLA9_9BACL|nr:aspartate aminotransferase family protein [Brevibacillus ruminantium]USG66640.1 aspartate aminotransferase family protein [Brevibacillus ruminantium]